MLGLDEVGYFGCDTFSDISIYYIITTIGSKQQRKFLVPFQEGFDGDVPTTLKKNTIGDITD